MTTSPGWMPSGPIETTSPGWVQGPDPIDVTVGGIRLRTSDSTLPEGGWKASLHTIDGWWDSAEDLSSETEHPSGDGIIVGSPRLGRRLITVTGLITAQRNFGPGSLTAALDVLGRLNRSLLVVAEPQRELAREADVRVRVSHTRLAPWLANYTLSLTADDPLRYSSEIIPLTPGVHVMENRGDMTAWPVLDVVGPHGDVTIEHPGGTWTLPGLEANRRRTVDCRRGVTFGNSGERLFSANAGSGPWPRVPPGGAEWTVTWSGAGSLRARRTEAWS